MNSAIAALAGAGGVRSGSIGIGFAIPVDNASRIAGELIASGRATHGWLGADVGDDPNNRGAEITGVTDGSPAAVAGLPIGSVITKVDDVVTGSANAFVAAVRSRAPGTQINLGCVEPSGVSRTVAVTLGSDQGRD
jgi:putative serine protease PepD